MCSIWQQPRWIYPFWFWINLDIFEFTHGESQNESTSNIWQNELPNIFWWNIKNDYKDAMYVLSNGNCVTIVELQSIIENEREQSSLLWWVIVILVLLNFEWICTPTSLLICVFVLQYQWHFINESWSIRGIHRFSKWCNQSLSQGNFWWLNR